jgi:hypothetical protein
LVANIEAHQGRELTAAELHRLAALDQQAELRGEDHVDAGEAPYDLDSSDDRAKYIGERLQVPQERKDPSGVRLDEDGETPSFNLDSRDERVAAIDAALAGVAVAAHDNDDLGDE